MLFEYEGRLLPYFKHSYNHASENDRTIEVPIAKYHINKVDSFLEIGNVLPNYYDKLFKAFPWPVLDKYSAGCINEDVTEFVPAQKYDLVVSISTFEHIGFKEFKYSSKKEKDDPNKVVRAVEQVRAKMLKPLGYGVVTIPVGFNKATDDLIFNHGLFDRCLYFERISEDNQLMQCDKKDILGCEFGKPYPWGNGLIIGFIRCRD